jgi:hypothetical protein
MDKGVPKTTTPIKPLGSSHMISEESEDLENRLSQLKNQVDEMSGSMLKLVDFSHSQEGLKREMKILMDQKKIKWKI